MVLWPVRFAFCTIVIVTRSQPRDSPAVRISALTNASLSGNQTKKAGETCKLCVEAAICFVLNWYTHCLTPGSQSLSSDASAGGGAGF